MMPAALEEQTCLTHAKLLCLNRAFPPVGGQQGGRCQYMYVSWQAVRA